MRVAIVLLLLAAASFGIGFAVGRGRSAAPPDAPTEPATAIRADGASSVPSTGKSAGDLGAQLMARVGQRFIVAERSPSGVMFYDQPKPYGHWLCRVNAYWVPRKTVTGQQVRGQDWWEDDVSVALRFGMWRRPSAPKASDAARHAACRDFRNFENTFVATPSGVPSAERAVFLLESVIMAAKGTRDPPFPVTCHHWSKHGDTSQGCDGRVVLAGLPLEGLRFSEELSFTHGEEFGSSRDELRIASRGSTGTMVALTIDSRQHWGRHSIGEGEVRSVTVNLDTSH